MNQISTSLELRKRLKEKKPEFLRQSAHMYRRIKRKWRKPKGIHSKMRHHIKGKRKMPSPGYKSPKIVKELHATGLRIVNIATVEDVRKIKKESEGIVISKNVGTKKRLGILKKAKELNIAVLNLDLDVQIKKIEDFITSKKKTIKDEKKKESEKKEKTEAKEGKKEGKTPEPKEKKVETEEEKQKREKKEKDRALTKQK